MTNKAAVILTMPEDWLGQMYLIKQYNQWLIDQKIDNKITINDSYGFPMAILLDPEDAVAFKLRFDL